MRDRGLGIHIHEEWIGMTQPVGLVVEPLVLDRLGIFPETSIRVVSDLQERLYSLFEDQIKGDQVFSSVKNFKDFCKEVLGWKDSDLIKPETFNLDNKDKEIYVSLDDYQEILQPDWIVPEFTGNDNDKKIQILVKELDVGTPFDQIIKNSNNSKYWEATHQQRFERLLKETENPIGILWNGISIRLVFAPRGESSGFINFPLEPMITVDGRPMIGAIEMLLGADRLFEGGSSNLRLRTLMEQSRKEQNEVSIRLSEQVLEALWILVKGFDEAEKKANVIGKTVLYDLPEKDPSHIYGGLLTVLLRLVFLLYSEDQELLPSDSIYSQNYSVNGLASRLRNERIEFQNSMEAKYGAWASLLSLFRLVFDGGGPYESYLPARHGELFDPENFPFLEGKEVNTSYKLKSTENIPLISDDVIEKVLTKLLILDGQLLSYRSLDVEQIGSVYEGIMGFSVEKSKNDSVGILYRPPKQKITVTFVVDIYDLLSTKSSKREKWLNDQAGVDLKLSSNIKKSLRHASNLSEICHSLESRLSPHTSRGLKSNSLYLQPTLARRKSGSHYTPRSLTEPIVSEVFRPWLEKYKYKPSMQQILDLKICDPAMGSGAFLVAACRFLGGYLVSAWNKYGYPSEYKASSDKDLFARRLVAQNCIYGVDKNPFAVNLAKLSLWLVTLSKDLPFTFLDHSLKCGDSLVGFSLKEIESSYKSIQLDLFNFENNLLERIKEERKEIFSIDSQTDNSYMVKENLLKSHSLKINKLTKVGDLKVAAFLNFKKVQERISTEKSYISLLHNYENNEENCNFVNKILNGLKKGDKGIIPFHWELEFPEVFNPTSNGFDFFLGNPPFAGNNTLVKSYPTNIHEWFKFINPKTGGQCDLVAHFFRRSFNLLKPGGILGLIATNTIAQGDTRDSGLKWICQNNGTIFSARKKFKWPGQASVVVSTIHLIKEKYYGQKKLDGKVVNDISAFLTASNNHENPKLLETNKNKSFQGSKPYGKGFIFDDSRFSDEDSPGVPSPLRVYERLAEESKNLEVIFPYIGGDEVSSNPKHSGGRYIVDFRDFTEKYCQTNYEEVFNLVKKKVKPERQRLNADGSFKLKGALRQKWWLHERIRPGLYNSIASMKRVLAITQTSKYASFVFLNARQVFDQRLYIFPLDSYKDFAILQSNIHLIWAYFFGSTLGEGHVYSSSDCFENFPFPEGMFLENDTNQYTMESFLKLEKLGREFYDLRSKIMIENDLGITKIYNKFHSPKIKDNQIIKLRSLQKEIDFAVLNSYGWNDLFFDYGFNLDSLDIEINENLINSDNVKDFMDKGKIYIEEINEASLFNIQLENLITNKKEIPWEYSFSYDAKQDILGRLLKLNQKRFLENDKNLISTKKNLNKVNMANNYKKDLNQLGLNL